MPMANAGTTPVLRRLIPFIELPHRLFFDFFKASGLACAFYQMVSVRVSLVDRVPEQSDQPHSQNRLRHPCGGVRIKQIVCGFLSVKDLCSSFYLGCGKH